MSRFRNAVSARDSQIFTLRLVCGMLFVALLTASTGWMLAPRNLTIHNPPDLRSGSTKKMVGSATVNGVQLCLLHFPAAQCLAQRR